MEFIKTKEIKALPGKEMRRAWAGQAGLRWVAKLVSAAGCEAMGGLLAAGQPAGCAWNLGWAGWAELCLGGLVWA